MGWFDGTNKCRKRGRAHFVGDEGMLEFSKQICRDNPGNYHSADDFRRAFMKSNPAIRIEDEVQDTEEAVQNRNQSIRIAVGLLILVVLSYFGYKWISK